MQRLLACLLAIFFVGGAPARAAGFPEKTVDIVVPYVAGGITDQIGRILAEKLSRKWNVPVLVENRAGGGGAIGAAYVARSRPDGTTLLVGSVGMSTNQFMLKDMPYKPNDMVPLLHIAKAPLVLYVRASLPVDSVQELVAYARQNPGKLTFANSGVGSSPHLAAALLQDKAGIRITHVPYKGTGAAVTDFLGGQVDAYFDTMQSMPYVASGKIKALAIADDMRLKAAPKLPTVGEAGVPGVVASSWWGIFLPAGTPVAVQQTLGDAIARAMNEPDTVTKVDNQGAVVDVRDQQAFEQFFDRECKVWGDLIQRLNLMGS